MHDNQSFGHYRLLIKSEFYISKYIEILLSYLTKRHVTRGVHWGGMTNPPTQKERTRKNIKMLVVPPTPFEIATINNNLTTTNDIIRRNFYFEKIKKQKQNNVHPHPLPPPCGRFCPSPPKSPNGCSLSVDRLCTAPVPVCDGATRGFI